MHTFIVEKIRQNPCLIEHFAKTLKRWRNDVSPAFQPYLMEWEQALGTSLDDCLALAVEQSERADALRQSSPFTGILTHKERFAFLKSWSVRHAP